MQHIPLDLSSLRDVPAPNLHVLIYSVAVTWKPAPVSTPYHSLLCPLSSCSGLQLSSLPFANPPSTPQQPDGAF